ncbi:MAG: hypothetical protein ACI8RD_009838 [Bacillariaceae sp.]|jgi:hypothetical protein
MILLEFLINCRLLQRNVKMQNAINVVDRGQKLLFCAKKKNHFSKSILKLDFPQPPNFFHTKKDRLQ